MTEGNVPHSARLPTKSGRISRNAPHSAHLTACPPTTLGAFTDKDRQDLEERTTLGALDGMPPYHTRRVHRQGAAGFRGTHRARRDSRHAPAALGAFTDKERPDLEERTALGALDGMSLPRSARLAACPCRARSTWQHQEGETHFCHQPLTDSDKKGRLLFFARGAPPSFICHSHNRLNAAFSHRGTAESRIDPKRTAGHLFCLRSFALGSLVQKRNAYRQIKAGFRILAFESPLLRISPAVSIVETRVYA